METILEYKGKIAQFILENFIKKLGLECFMVTVFFSGILTVATFYFYYEYINLLKGLVVFTLGFLFWFCGVGFLVIKYAERKELKQSKDFMTKVVSKLGSKDKEILELFCKGDSFTMELDMHNPIVCGLWSACILTSISDIAITKYGSYYKPYILNDIFIPHLQKKFPDLKFPGDDQRQKPKR